jgi:L1 cell adhesion molecule like protein
MNIHAEDKASKKANKIVITNEKGRLSNAEIERLVKEAAARSEDDKLLRERIEAKNSLESTTYSIRNTLTDEKFKDKFGADEKSKLERLVEETIKWVESHSDATTDDFKTKLKELETVFHPIM